MTKNLICTLTILITKGMILKGETIAFWGFNGGFDYKDESSQIVHSADIGTGTIYQQRGDTDGNGKTGRSYTLNGTTINEGKAMAWDDVSKSGNNDAEFFITFSTTGYSDIKISMDLGGNSDDGIESFDVKYSLEPLEDAIIDDVDGFIKDFKDGLSIGYLNDWPSNKLEEYRRMILDLSGNNGSIDVAEQDQLKLSAIENQEYVVLRFDDWEDNDALKIDNVLIEGTKTYLNQIPLTLENYISNGRSLIKLSWPSKLGHSYRLFTSEDMSLWKSHNSDNTENDEAENDHLNDEMLLAGDGGTLEIDFEITEGIKFLKVKEFLIEE